MNAKLFAFFGKIHIWVPGMNNSDEAAQAAYDFWAPIAGWNRRSGASETALRQNRKQQVLDLCRRVTYWSVKNKRDEWVIGGIYISYHEYKKRENFWQNFFHKVQEKVEEIDELDWESVKKPNSAIKGFIW